MLDNGLIVETGTYHNLIDMNQQFADFNKSSIHFSKNRNNSIDIE
jgi:hypothetical protein